MSDFSANNSGGIGSRILPVKDPPGTGYSDRIEISVHF